MNEPSHNESFGEWLSCSSLRQADIDRLIAAGVPPLALARDGDGCGLALARDHVVFLGGARFEFARNLRDAAGAASAIIVPCRDELGDLADLLAWRGDHVANWLGCVSMLGQHSIHEPRFDDPLIVHATILDWLRDGRHGVVILHPRRAAQLLQNSPLGVISVTFGAACAGNSPSRRRVSWFGLLRVGGSHDRMDTS